jgi:hypothetical protein
MITYERSVTIGAGASPGVVLDTLAAFLAAVHEDMKRPGVVVRGFEYTTSGPGVLHITATGVLR